MLINQLKEELGFHWKLLLALLVMGSCAGLGVLGAALLGVTAPVSLLIAGLVMGAIAGVSALFYNIAYLIVRGLDDKAYQAGGLHTYWKGITGILVSLSAGLGAGLVAGLSAPVVPALAAITIFGVAPLAFLASPLLGTAVAATVVACLSFAAVAASFLVLRMIYKATCKVDNKYNKDYENYNSEKAGQDANWINNVPELEISAEKPPARTCFGTLFKQEPQVKKAPPQENLMDAMEAELLSRRKGNKPC